MAASIPHRAPLRLVTAAPAAQPLAESAAAPGLCARELTISIWAGDWVTYEGTRAQLEDEGLIPKDAEWPARDSILEWKAGGLDYQLHRTRPAGLKGPKRTWLEMDNWCVYVQPDRTNFRLDDWYAQCIEEKAEALRAEIHRYSPAGRRAEATSCNQRWAAHQDKAFQAFKSTLLPERKKLGRKPKVQAVEGPQQAV